VSGASRDDRIRGQLIEHLHRLQQEGVWGLSVAAHRDATSQPPAPVGAAGIDDGDESLESIDAGIDDGDESLEAIDAEAQQCVACRLHETRNSVVFGVGSPNARLMFIGEGPGRDEDLQGEPFVGRAGQLLTKIIEAMGYARSDVYIANAVKCRPPQNRDPKADEVGPCRHFLMRQISAIRPEIIVLLGRSAVLTVLEINSPLSRLRGQFRDWNGTRVMCTYHPAYLLRNPSAKGMVWEDMQLVRDILAASAADD